MVTGAQEELCESAANTGLDDFLNLVVVAIREVRQRPASVREHLFVIAVDQPRQRGQCQLGLQSHCIFASA